MNSADYRLSQWDSALPILLDRLTNAQIHATVAHATAEKMRPSIERVDVRIALNTVLAELQDVRQRVDELLTLKTAEAAPPTTLHEPPAIACANEELAPWETAR